MFDYELEDTLPSSAFESIIKLVDIWKDAAKGGAQPTLTLHRAPNFIQVIDHRDPDTTAVHTFEGAWPISTNP